MEHGPVGISSPAFSVGGVSTEHVIVGQEVLVAEVLGGLSVVSDGFRVGTYLTLRESHTYLHTQPPFRNTLNAWCELRSPTQQVCKGQAGTTELIVEPDAEVVQRHPRRQASPQSLKLMGPLPPEAEGVEQLLVDALHDLADARDPPPQTFGPASLAGVAFGRMDDVRSVTLEPPEVVFSALEALVGYVGSRSGRAHADEPSVGLGSQDEEGFRHLLVGCGSVREAEARYDPGRVRGGQQAETFVPSQAVGPSDVRTTGQPSMSPALTVSDRHSRAIQSFVRRPLSVQDSDQVHDESFDEICVGTHEAVELRAIWQGGKSIAQAGPWGTGEVPHATEASPPSEDGQGDHLACAQRGLRAWLLRGWRMRVAEVVHHNGKCSEEGVHIDHEESVPFPWGSVSKPTLANGHLPLKLRADNSHQALRACPTREPWRRSSLCLQRSSCSGRR